MNGAAGLAGLILRKNGIESMDEASKRKQQLQKVVETGSALSQLEGNPGWDVLKTWLKEAQEAAKRSLANPSKTKSMNDVIQYQAKHDHALKTLRMVEKGIKDGLKAQEELSD